MDQRDRWACPVCDEEKKKVDLECQHSVCEECIQKWVRKENSCPMCRSPIHTINIGGKERKVLTRRQPVPKSYLETVALPNVIVSAVDMDLGVDEKCELQAEMAYCMHCGGSHNSDVLLLCDNMDCLQAAHTFCDYPQLHRVPAGQWFCVDCKDSTS